MSEQFLSSVQMYIYFLLIKITEYFPYFFPQKSIVINSYVDTERAKIEEEILVRC